MTLFTSKCEQSLCFEHLIIKFTAYVRRKLLPVFLVKTNFKILLVTKRYFILRDFCCNHDSRSELILMMLVVVVFVFGWNHAIEISFEGCYEDLFFGGVIQWDVVVPSSTSLKNMVC